MQDKILCIYPFLAGRSLLFDEIKRICVEKGLSLSSAEQQEVLQLLVQLGKAKQVPAIYPSYWAIRRRCERCGAGPSYIETSRCAKCQTESCMYCTCCLFMGRVKSCMLLYHFLPINEPYQEISAKLFPLLPAQQNTVDKLQEWLDSTKQNMTFLVVPGAGKVVMLASMLQAFLHQGKRIFWSRRQEQQELLMKRLSLLFSQNSSSPVTVGTDWELLRYYQQFDLIILDGVEVPEQIIKRALQKRGKLLTITSTFPKKHTPSMIVHPIRQHGCAIPIPIFVQKRRLKQAMQQKNTVMEFCLFIEKVKTTKGQALIVVPSVDDVFLVMDWLKTVLPHVASETGQLAFEQDREIIMPLFEEKKFTFLLIPLWLVRSLRIANLHLCVLFADHLAFHRSCLVELSLHVGINASFPSGEVWFLGNERTKMIEQAKKEHKYLNELAKKEGYL